MDTSDIDALLGEAERSEAQPEPEDDSFVETDVFGELLAPDLMLTSSDD